MGGLMRGIAIITGASRGIGAATALLAAKSGYDVCINYVADKAAATGVAETCRNEGVRAIVAQADVGEPEAVRGLFLACDQQLGAVTLLVNNAGIIGSATRVVDLTDEVLHKTFRVNTFGPFYCAREAIRRMSTKTGGTGGVIINISSQAAYMGSPGEYVHYAASKGALDTLTIGLSKEVGREGIRVNGVHAGTTDTDIHRLAGNPNRPRMVAEKSPLGRVATPQDIAEAAIWLASDKASYATGTTLCIGGGM